MYGQADNSSLELDEQLACWVMFLEQWQQALDTQMEVIVLGDFNLDFLSFNRTDLPTNSQASKLKPLVDELFTRIIPYGVRQCVSGTTRQGRPGQADTALDHFWTNIPGKISPIQTMFNGFSDHRVIKGVRFAKLIRNSTRYVKKRSYKNFNESEFRRRIKNLSFWDIYCSTDVNDASNLLAEKLNVVLDQMAPIRTFQTRTNYSPWLSPESKKLINDRNNAQQKASESKSEEDWSVYKTIRNYVNSILKNEKSSWQKKKLENCNNDSGKLWKNVLGWLNWCSSSAPTKLFSAGQIITSPSLLANIMNTYFITKVNTIRQNLPPVNDDPLKTLKKIMRNRNSVTSFKFVDPDEVKKVILGLKNSKYCGFDNIDTYVLKLAVDEILPAVTHIINLSLQQCTFPSAWKVAKVIPLFKKGDSLEPKNYRPVAILVILSKVLERIVFKQIVEYMDSQKLFNPNHHGFRGHHSTSTAMIQMYDTWVEAVDQGEFAGVCMLDMSAAFDVVDPDLLLQKLALYGFDEEAVKWMRNYLTDRSQSVYID